MGRAIGGKAEGGFKGEMERGGGGGGERERER
jgi:hypothetical protein